MATTKLALSAMYSGQGMCNVIEAYDGATVTKLMLCDFGAEKDSATARLYTLESLKTKVVARGKIDVLVISHSDRDHWNLMGELLDILPSTIKIDVAAWGIGNWMNAADAFQKKVKKRLATKTSTKFLYAAWTDIDKGGAEIKSWDLGWDGVIFNVLAASVREWDVKKSVSVFLEEPNTASIVLRCRFGGKYSILTGDATWATLKFINTKMGKYTFPADGFLVTAPHHGAIATLNYELTDLETFIGKCKQKCSLASAQLRSGFNHPNVCVMATMAKYGGKDIYAGGAHDTVINFPGTDLCDTDVIYKSLDASKGAVARTGYLWYEVPTEYNIFTTLISGGEAVNWHFDTAADGTLTVTQSDLMLDFARGVIFPTAERPSRAARIASAQRDATEFYVGTPPLHPSPPEAAPETPPPVPAWSNPVAVDR